MASIFIMGFTIMCILSNLLTDRMRKTATVHWFCLKEAYIQKLTAKDLTSLWIEVNHVEIL